MEKELILVKLGGSLITDKTKPYTANFRIINRLTREIKEAREKANLNLILGHGGGSFPHTSAKKYKTTEGILNDQSLYGICVVQNDAAKLNRYIVEALLKVSEKAISIQPSACFLAKNSKIIEGYLKTILEILKKGIIPVPYGDVALDLKKGCCILSTEEILSFLTRNLSGFNSKKLIMAGVTKGVFNTDPFKNPQASFIPIIDKENWKKVKHNLTGSAGIDVTGGMALKVGKAIELAKLGFETEIISGLEKGNLKRCLLGERVGTLIKW